VAGFVLTGATSPTPTVFPVVVGLVDSAPVSGALLRPLDLMSSDSLNWTPLALSKFLAPSEKLSDFADLTPKL
jgi:hypothetical protein